VSEEYGNGESNTIQNRKYSHPWTDLLRSAINSSRFLEEFPKSKFTYIEIRQTLKFPFIL